MKVCPSCHHEYEAHATVCADCGSALIDAPAPEDDTGRYELRLCSDDPPVSVFTAADENGALMIQGLLETNGIEAVIRTLRSPMVYDGMVLSSRPAWGEVLVLRSREAEARKLIEDYTKAAETGS